jgi:hypothetical protein
MPKKKKEDINSIQPKISDFLEKKLVDASRENGKTTLHFSNGYKLKLSGNISFGVE